MCVFWRLDMIKKNYKTKKWIIEFGLVIQENTDPDNIQLNFVQADWTHSYMMHSLVAGNIRIRTYIDLRQPIK